MTEIDESRSESLIMSNRRFWLLIGLSVPAFVVVRAFRTDGSVSGYNVLMALASYALLLAFIGISLLIHRWWSSHDSKAGDAESHG